MVTKYPCFTLYSATRNLRGFFICFLIFSLKNASWYNKPCFCLLFFFVCDAFLCFFLCFFECPFGFSRCYWNTQFSICLAGLNFSDLVCLFWMGIGWPFNLSFVLIKELSLWIVCHCQQFSYFCLPGLMWIFWLDLTWLDWFYLSVLIHIAFESWFFVGFYLNIFGRFFLCGRKQC